MRCALDIWWKYLRAARLSCMFRSMFVVSGPSSDAAVQKVVNNKISDNGKKMCFIFFLYTYILLYMYDMLGNTTEKAGLMCMYMEHKKGTCLVCYSSRSIVGRRQPDDPRQLQ